MGTTKLEGLRLEVKKLYKKHSAILLFHGWHHIYFVSKKAVEFAQSIGADTNLVEAAALLHDINYIIETNSKPEIAKGARKEILTKYEYSDSEILKIEKIIIESHTAYRGEKISNEGKALSDADSLFKVLPTTPILFSSRYIIQNKVDIYKWAKKISTEQFPLLDRNIYFYTKLAKKKYLKWAKQNLELVNEVQKALEDDDVKEMLEIARRNKII